jgi:hypothetical protein
MQHLTGTAARHPLTIGRTVGRWALPAAALLAVTTMGSARAIQAPADHAAEFDPGSACAGSTVAGPAYDPDLRLSRLVISAHAAGLRAAR